MQLHIVMYIHYTVCSCCLQAGALNLKMSIWKVEGGGGGTSPNYSKHSPTIEREREGGNRLEPSRGGLENRSTAAIHCVIDTQSYRKGLQCGERKIIPALKKDFLANISLYSLTM